MIPSLRARGEDEKLMHPVIFPEIETAGTMPTNAHHAHHALRHKST
jgi:hypothetical protein